MPSQLRRQATPAVRPRGPRPPRRSCALPDLRHLGLGQGVVEGSQPDVEGQAAPARPETRPAVDVEQAAPTPPVAARRRAASPRPRPAGDVFVDHERQVEVTGRNRLTGRACAARRGAATSASQIDTTNSADPAGQPVGRDHVGVDLTDRAQHLAGRRPRSAGRSGRVQSGDSARLQRTPSRRRASASTAHSRVASTASAPSPATTMARSSRSSGSATSPGGGARRRGRSRRAARRGPGGRR